MTGVQTCALPILESLTELKERKAREEEEKKRQAEEERLKKEAEEKARQEEEAKKQAEEEAAKPVPKWILEEEKKKRAAERRAKKKAEEEAARLKAEEALLKAQLEKEAEALKEAERKAKEAFEKQQKEEKKRKEAEAKALAEKKKREEAEERARKAEEEAKKKAESISPLQALRNKFNSGKKLNATEKQAMIDLTHEDIQEKLKTLKTFKKLDEDYVRKTIHKGKGKYDIWTPIQRKSYDDYVQTSDSFRLNERLYTGKYKPNSGNKTDREIDGVTKLIAGSKLKEDSQFVRFSGVQYLNTVYKDVGIKNPFGNGDIFDYDLSEAADMLNAALAGKTTVHQSFTSVSYNVDKNVFTSRPILMEIYAEKGIEALYTVNYTESEVVLQRGTEFEIIGFEPHMSKDKWGDEQMQLKMILKAKAKK